MKKILIHQRIPVLYQKRNDDGSVQIKNRTYLTNAHGSTDNKKLFIKSFIDRFVCFENEKYLSAEIISGNSIDKTKEDYWVTIHTKIPKEDGERIFQMSFNLFAKFFSEEYKLNARSWCGTSGIIDITPEIFQLIKLKAMELCDPYSNFEPADFVDILRSLGLPELNEELDSAYYRVMQRAHQEYGGLKK